MDFEFGETVHRDRRPGIADPYNPARTVPGDWAGAETIVLELAFVAASSSRALTTATRMQMLTAKSLYLTEPDADVKAGDRIRVGGTEDDLDSGTPYMVPARPAGDTNPFTGWQPVVEIPLELVEG